MKVEVGNKAVVAISYTARLRHKGKAPFNLSPGDNLQILEIKGKSVIASVNGFPLKVVVPKGDYPKIIVSTK